MQNATSDDFIRPHPDGVCLAVKVTPRAARNEIGQAAGGELRVKLKAPPVDGAANDALVEFLAETLGCAKAAVQIIRGQSSRHKQVLLRGAAPEHVRRAMGRR